MTRLLRLDASIRRDVMAWRAEQGTQGPRNDDAYHH
jgi:hypothetical protein